MLFGFLYFPKLWAKEPGDTDEIGGGGGVSLLSIVLLVFLWTILKTFARAWSIYKSDDMKGKRLVQIACNYSSSLIWFS